MSSYIKKLEELKIMLFRLHFLLTEAQSKQAEADSIVQFKICYNLAMECLAGFIKDEFDIKSKSDINILDVALEKRLFNKDMIDSMREMEADFSKLDDAAFQQEAHQKIQNKYARFLQMSYDMLVRMGQDAEE